jgi:hypothetical protein
MLSTYFHSQPPDKTSGRLRLRVSAPLKMTLRHPEFSIPKF